MLVRWSCQRLHPNAVNVLSRYARPFSASVKCRADLAATAAEITTDKTRNIGIIAHIDAVCKLYTPAQAVGTK